MQNGWCDTLNSYNVKSTGAEAVDELRDRMPEEHRNFVRNLSLYWENETHFACHAYFNPEAKLPRELRFLSDELATETLWSRFPELKEQTSTYGCGKTIGLNTARLNMDWDKIGVFGHTPFQCYQAVVPIKYQQLRLIDGWAFTGECLVAYCVELDNHILQATDFRDIKSY